MQAFRAKASAAAWCRAADITLALMVWCSRRWMDADGRLMAASPAAWQCGQRSIRLRSGHGHYRTTAAYRPAARHRPAI